MPDIAHLTRVLDEKLPDLAREVICRYLDLSDPANEHFLLDPDARDQHQSNWHQWGIITHTRRFLAMFDADVPRYLQEWNLWECIGRQLRAEIDGATKWELLHIAILLHDIGKFGARVKGKHRFHFTNHESLSGRITRTELDLEGYGLTPVQIEYIARTAEDHFVLGLVRKRAREQREYNGEFVRSRQFAGLVENIRHEHPDDFLEIGVLFLGDSISKVDPVHGPRAAVDQFEINIVVARHYLELVSGVAR